jgi:hypothetical protein
VEALACRVSKFENVQLFVVNSYNVSFLAIFIPDNIVRITELLSLLYRGLYKDSNKMYFVFF